MTKWRYRKLFILLNDPAGNFRGIPFEDIGCLNYFANTGYGQGNRSKIEVVGEDPSKHVVKYQMHDKIAELLTRK